MPKEMSTPSTMEFDEPTTLNTRGPSRMNTPSPEQARDTLEVVYRNESRRVLATLIRLLGDFEVAEDALQNAVVTAMEQWPREGVPQNPRAWLISVGRFKAIDHLRRRARYDPSFEAVVQQLQVAPFDPTQLDERHLEDDRLRLIFTCCHPALPSEACIALTLREVCGLTTEEIARAFLTSAPTIAKRIVRAKAKIRDSRIPYEVPSRTDLPERLDRVLQVVYLVFTEGYSASSGASLVRADLAQEAIRLGRLLQDLLPEPEVLGLLALMLLHESRRAARVSREGELILLEDQDRSLWDRSFIDEGKALIERALTSRAFGPYTLQAAIAALHSDAPSTDRTDWTQIIELYGLLLRMNPSPVIELNRAVAVAMRDGPSASLPLIERILDRGDLREYYLAHAARADMCRRMGNVEEAVKSYLRALSLVRQEPARRFLERRLHELTKK
jgi:RNA polymerase sigma-70 factor, ECF subfamily